MPYYVRAFCTDEAPPSIDQLELALKSENPSVRFEADEDRQATDWANADFHYKAGKQPIIIEVNINDGPASLAEEDIQDFVDEIGKPGFSISKRRVLGHLAETRFIICCQLPTDIDDDGYHWNGELLNYFVENHGGMIQADGEGFYDGHKVIVALS